MMQGRAKTGFNAKHLINHPKICRLECYEFVAQKMGKVTDKQTNKKTAPSLFQSLNKVKPIK